MHRTVGALLRAKASLVSLVSLTLLVALMVPTAAASDGSCRVRNLGTSMAYPSLQAAVDGASAGDRLVVKGLCRGGTVVDRDLDISGVRTARWGRPVLDGERKARVLKIARAATVTLRGLNIRGGHINYGAGIMNRGTLTVKESRIRDNRAEEAGGAIANVRLARLTLRKVALRGNSAFGNGGALWSLGPAAVRGSRLVANRAISGGAIVNGSRMAISGSLVRGNKAIGNGIGGGIWTFGSLTLRDTRVTGNRVDGQGGGIHGSGKLVGVTCGPGGNVYGNTPDDCYFE